MIWMVRNVKRGDGARFEITMLCKIGSAAADLLGVRCVGWAL